MTPYLTDIPGGQLFLIFMFDNNYKNKEKLTLNCSMHD